MTDTAQSEPVSYTTGKGHEIFAQLVGGIVRDPKAINRDGVVVPLDAQCAHFLTHAIQASAVAEYTLIEKSYIEEIIARFPPSLTALGPQCPAIAPHYKQLNVIATLASTMLSQAELFQNNAKNMADLAIAEYEKKH